MTLDAQTHVTQQPLNALHLSLCRNLGVAGLVRAGCAKVPLRRSL